MCGFLGEFLFEPYRKITEFREFEKLLALSKHRGPDNSKIHGGENYQLGFNRLAILDLSDNANQPIFSPSKRFHVVFNGEIYNYQELAKTYNLTNLRSTSDTEVLVQLFDKLGIEETVKQLNGMFAITLIDTQNDIIYLIRDFAGIKPLFYGLSEQGIVAASQFDQVFKHSWFAADLILRPEIMKEYFGLGYMQAPNTIYNNIYQVLPGEILIINRKAAINKKRFCCFDDIIYNSGSGVNDGIIEKSIQNAVQSQLISDVPLASFLSGGIDSPLITAMAHRADKEIEAFTIGVEEENMDESVAAKVYAEHLKLKHNISHIEAYDFLQIIDDHFLKLPEPLGDYSSIPTYLLTKEAKKKYTVMLSGDGGDELFFGYPRMLHVYKHRHWFKLAFVLRKPLFRVAHKLGWVKTWGPYNFKDISEWVMAKQSHILSAPINAIFPEADYSREIKELFTIDKNDLLNSLRLNEFYGHMQRVLIKVDRMSMANSLEVRVPFLDKAVITNAMSNIPMEFRKKSDLKSVLKYILRNFYPDKTIKNQKKGFTVPIDQWLRNELKSDVERLILEESFYGNNIINVEQVKQFVRDFYLNKHNSAWGVWHIYAWQKWAKAHNLN